MYLQPSVAMTEVTYFV